jgi:hypothetical protein
VTLWGTSTASTRRGLISVRGLQDCKHVLVRRIPKQRAAIIHIRGGTAALDNC